MFKFKYQNKKYDVVHFFFDRDNTSVWFGVVLGMV